jgi:hypothetical protein
VSRASVSASPSRCVSVVDRNSPRSKLALLVLPVPCASEMGSRECRAPLRHRRRMCAGLACKSVTNKHGSPPLPQTIETPDWSHIHPRSHASGTSIVALASVVMAANVRHPSESLACEWRRTSHARPHDPGPTSPDRFRAPKHRSPRSSRVREAGSQAVRESPRAHAGRRSRRWRRRHKRVSPLVVRADRREPATRDEVPR